MFSTINIVIYTDCHSMFAENPISARGSLTDLVTFTRENTKNLVNVRFTFVNRHPADPETGIEIHAGNKITDELLKTADELWIFGRRKINNEKEPENELTDPEVGVLKNWMNKKKGGVFVTGDHSEPDETLPNPSCETADHNTFLSLGRALGHRIPRANQLRNWQGPPTNCNKALPIEARDNFNTQEGTNPCQLDSDLLQYDSTPQTIFLTLKKCRPHRLLWYVDANGDSQFITKLPDHTHEGIVVAPEELNSEWPVHSLRPEVIARGRDKRFPNEERFGGLLTAFDGDSVDVGRIVADSSFHHYLNSNLQGVRSRNNCCGLPDPGSDLDQIAQFFGNLALWLAPSDIRNKIGYDLLLSLSRHPDVLEVKDHGILRIGQVARAVLNITIGAGKLLWLFGPSEFEQMDPTKEFLSHMFIDDENGSWSDFVTLEFRLGVGILFCLNFLRTQKIADVTKFAGAAQLIADLQQKWTTILHNDQEAIEQLLKGAVKI